MTDGNNLKQPSTIAAGLQPLATDITTLTPMPGNPRRGDITAIAKSLKAFGQRKPIVANKDRTVLAGNHTLAAAITLGWTQVAVVFVDDDSTTAKAFALADNRTVDLGDYNNEALAALIADVRDTDKELLAATSWSDTDLIRILNRSTPPTEFGSIDVDGLDFKHQCPKCNYEWS